MVGLILQISMIALHINGLITELVLKIVKLDII
jgi:hypothetical protein